MTTDAGRPTDDQIEQLVRDAAASWTPPPVRLDQPGWRDRVRSPAQRRRSAIRAALGRLGQAATAALVLTVAGALIAVYLTRPPSDVASSPEPSVGSSPSAVPTLLPKLIVEGELPEPSSVVVFSERGFVVADLARGALGTPLAGSRWGSAVLRQGDGSLLCLCISESSYANGTPTVAEIRLNHYAADGTQLSSERVLEVTGQPDPRDGGQTLPMEPSHLATSVGFSADRRFGVVGWSRRAHPIWESGVVVVDLEAGSASSLRLPDRSSGEGDRRTVVDAPRVVGFAGVERGLVLGREFHSWTPPASTNPVISVGSQAFVITIDGGSPRQAAELDVADAGERVIRAGPLPGGGTWVATQGDRLQHTTLRRFDAGGAVSGGIDVPVGVTIEGEVSAVSPDGSALFLWDPFTTRLVRVDAATGALTEGAGDVARADRGLLAEIGDWLAPTAVAKVFLRAGLAVSPDGSRIYALGVDPASAESTETGGSTGVYAFDAATLALLGRWEPRADYASLAVSLDGRFVYAAGMPSVGADGLPRTNQPSSITVHDASDGAVRLLAGSLGHDLLTFPSTIVR